MPPSHSDGFRGVTGARELFRYRLFGLSSLSAHHLIPAKHCWNLVLPWPPVHIVGSASRLATHIRVATRLLRRGACSTTRVEREGVDADLRLRASPYPLIPARVRPETRSASAPSPSRAARRGEALGTPANLSCKVREASLQRTRRKALARSREKLPPHNRWRTCPRLPDGPIRRKTEQRKLLRHST